MNKEKNELFHDLLQNGVSQLKELEDSESLIFNHGELPEETDKSFKKGYNYAIRILSKRDYSVFKMQQKLKERSFDKNTADEIIEKLLEQNYLREEEYTRMRIKHLIYKGYANQFIIRKLEQEMLSADEAQIDHLRTENNVSTQDTLIRLIEKKLRGKNIPEDFTSKMKLKAKISNFLISKGYSFEEINSKMSEYIR